MKKQQYNKSYLCRYYADSSTRENKLIGFDSIKQIVYHDTKPVKAKPIYDRIISKLTNNTLDKIEIRLSRGLKFVFVCK